MRLSKDLTVRNFEVQRFTGYPTSTVGKGQWARGTLSRWMAPEFRPSTRNLAMYDPTDPQTWKLANQ